MSGMMGLLDRIEKGFELSMEALTSSDVHELADEGLVRYVGLTVELTQYGHKRLGAYRKRIQTRIKNQAAQSYIAP